MHGLVLDQKTKKPIPNTTIDVWEASTNGLYEQQDENQVDCNLRGKFKSDSNGRYAFYCLRPTAYPIPNDGKPHPENIVLLC
jgi:catechol 1,2-dioxygenase